jgi:hypothetical protein
MHNPSMFEPPIMNQLRFEAIWQSLILMLYELPDDMRRP